jgi:hypothetical protein
MGSNPEYCRVQRATMEEWKSKSSVPTMQPAHPTITAFYHRLQPSIVPTLISTGAPQGGNQARVSSESKNLQRVLIWSPILHMELETLFSSALPLPIAYVIINRSQTGATIA